MDVSEPNVGVLLIQPPEPAPSTSPVAATGDDPRSLSPVWDLLCLETYLREHTRHHAAIVDARLFSDLESEMVQAVREAGIPRLAVVQTCAHALGQATAVLTIIKRHFPDVLTGTCGEFPSQFPSHALEVPNADFALAGDPEPILRNLLDYLDLPPRWPRIPGLAFEGCREVKPFWLERLHSLSICDWQDVFWNAYVAPPPARGTIARICISRGHTRLAADRACGLMHEPLRVWPLDRVAGAVQRCANLPVTEVIVADPPGVWTQQRLSDWCEALEQIRNRQAWGLEFLPTMLSVDTIRQLRESACHRVCFLFPSCDNAILQRYGCVISPADLARTCRAVEEAGIRVHVKFWIGGPEEREGEALRVTQALRALAYVHASLHPFPFALDAPVYAELAETASVPLLADWIRWARDPWMVERPLPEWQGAESVEDFARTTAGIQRHLQRSPRHLLKRAIEQVQSVNWIRSMEDRALALLVRPKGGNS